MNPVADVSVVIPAHNAAATIETTIESARSQTVRPAEILVIDDASSDSTAVVVERLVLRWPEVRLIRLSVNGGVSAARNLGAREAVSTWIGLLDADDLWLPQKLERQLAFAEAHPELSMIGSYYRELFGSRIGAERRELWWQSACLIKRSVFEDVAFDPTWSVSELPEFFSRFDGPHARDGVREPLMLYRMNTTGLAHRSFFRERMAWLLIDENVDRRADGRPAIGFDRLLDWYREVTPWSTRLRNDRRWRGDWMLRRALIEASRRRFAHAALYGAAGSFLNPTSLMTKSVRLRSIGRSRST